MNIFSHIWVIIFMTGGIMILAGRADKLVTERKGKEKYYIKRQRLVWGILSILYAVACLFKDYEKNWFFVIVPILLIAAIILQETWAKKKDSDL